MPLLQHWRYQRQSKTWSRIEEEPVFAPAPPQQSGAVRRQNVYDLVYGMPEPQQLNQTPDLVHSLVANRQRSEERLPKIGAPTQVPEFNSEFM